MNDNFFENMFNASSKLHQRTKRYVVKKIDSDVVFEKSEETFFDADNGPRTEEINIVHPADCGHIVGFYGPHELVGRCAKCSKTLCHRCGNLRCKRCLDILCSSCARLVNGIEVYCSKCRFIYFLKKGSLFSLKGIHQFLLKEIN